MVSERIPQCSLKFLLLVQMGLSSPQRLAQGQLIQFHTESDFPVQIDGEPWIQEPGILEISHHGQVFTQSFLPDFFFEEWKNADENRMEGLHVEADSRGAIGTCSSNHG